MGAVLTERVGALGDLAVSLDWDPVVFALLAEGALIRFRWGASADDKAKTLVVTRRGGDARLGILIGGRDPRILLGVDNRGPVIEDQREYIAGTNRLSNPRFGRLDPAIPTHALDWTFAEDTLWQATGTGLVTLDPTRLPTKDDILVAAEQPEARHSQTWEVSADVAWLFPTASPAGKLRLRLTYYGHFDNPNLFPSFDGDAWAFLDDNYRERHDPGDPFATESFDFIPNPFDENPSVTAVALQSRFPVPQIVLNPAFIDGLNHWLATNGIWVASVTVAPLALPSVYIDGGGFVKTNITTNVTAGTENILHDADTGTFTTGHIGMLVTGNGIPPYTYITAYSGPNDLIMSANATAAATGVTVTFELQGTPRKRLHTDRVTEGAIPEVPTGYPVDQGETWNCQAQVLRSDDSNGTASVYVRKTKTATPTNLAGAFDEQVGSVTTGGELVLSTAYTSPVKQLDKDVTIEPETTAIGVTLEVEGQSRGRFWFTNVLLQRVKGNFARMEARCAVNAGRPYRWSQLVYSGPNLRPDSTMRLAVYFTASGRASAPVIKSPDIKPKPGGGWQTVDFDFTVPSGYDTAWLQVEEMDVFGDWFYLVDGTLHDTDSTTRVADVVADGSLSTVAVSAVAPEGTEKVSAALVAEEGAFSWVVGNVWLHRINEPIPTAAEVVDDLLHDPITGQYRLQPGAIIGPDHLLHDWAPRYTSLRTALQHLSTSGLVYPLREDRVTGDLRYHWGTAEQLFKERGSLVLTRSRIIVRDGIGVERNAEERVDRVVVIGATKADARGRPVQVIGLAENDWGDRNPDTLVIEDSTAETKAHADALARYHLDIASTVIVNVRASLDNWRSIDDFDCGDWVFPENADAQLEDLSRAVDLAGETVYPVRERVVARTLRMGRADWSADVLDATTGQWVPLPGVLWERETSCDVELGTPLPNFLADPQHGSAAVQFNQFRLSAGR